MSARSRSARAGSGSAEGRQGGVPSRSRRMMMRCSGLVLAGAFYLLLIDTTSLPELYVGGAVALLAGVVFEAAREQAFAEATVKASWLIGAWRALIQIPADIVWISLAALQQLVHPSKRVGDLRAVKFEYGDPHSERDAGRRALAEVFGSLAPNTIIIGVDPDSDTLLAHQLRGKGEQRAIDPLGLG